MTAQPAVVLHPMLARGRAMRPLIEALGAGLSVRALDLPGHGRAPNWDGVQDYAESARDLIIDTLDEPAHLIGHSYGGYVALRLAADRPDLVLSLTLFEPVFFAAAFRTSPAIAEAYAEEAASFIAPLAAQDWDAAASAFFAYWGGGASLDALHPEQQKYITERVHLVHASEASLVDDSGTVWDRLPRLDIPCLLMSGAQSPAIVKTILDGLQSQLPNTTRIQIEGVGHMGPISSAGDVAREIRDFLSL